MLTDRALGRALLARQGLLQRHPPGVVTGVQRIGAMQAQQWSTLPVGLWSRVEAFTPAALYAALEADGLVVGTFLRGTIHLVTRDEHAAYAAIADAHLAAQWRMTTAEVPAGLEVMREASLDHARGVPRSPADFAAFFDAWVDEHPDVLAGEELAAQRAVSWRPMLRWARFARVPTSGPWSVKTPAARIAAPGARGDTALGAALEAATRRHLGAFGPAAAEDVAYWLGIAPGHIVAVFERIADELERFIDAAGRALFDLADAPRPDEAVDAPVRFLPAFDSTLLAHVPAHRGRIVSPEHRAVIYRPGNLRLEPTYLVDGRVAGRWSVAVARGEATLTLAPLDPLRAATRRALETEGAALVAATQPKAKACRVVLA